jgi:predicted phosphodiesterase
MQKVLFVPDTHAPFEDHKAFDLLVQAAKGFEPDYVIILGDFVDFYSVSAHDKDPKRKVKLEDEVDAAQTLLATLRNATKRRNKKVKYIYLAGNHEYRLDRYLNTVAPELHGVVSFEKLMELKQLGFQYVPYKDFFKLGRLYITHDTGRSGKYTAQQSLMDTQHNVVVGHAHRMSYCVEGDALGNPHVAACFGWLGDKEACDYMHRIRASRDWALGFGIGYLMPDGNVHLTPIPIVDYSCVVEGNLYQTKSRRSR